MTQPSGDHRIGIDLGTSNTVTVLRWPDGRTRPLLFDGSPAMPSAVFLDDSDTLHVGRDAQRLAMLDPGRYEPNPKRRIDDGAVLLGTREVPVVGLLAAVLRSVAAKTTETCGLLPPATLTYPAAWGSARQATLREAATRAGWRQVRLVPEPVAAAQYFTSVLRHPVPMGGALGVFDFGGGTLDIAVVRRDPTGFTVLSAGGLEDLGGLDLDAALVAEIGARIAATDPAVWSSLREPATPADRRNRRLFWDDVRAAKEMLSRSSTAPISVPGIDRAAHLTRDEFERLAGPLLERAVRATAATIDGCRLPPGQLTGIFLVGGASRIPLVAGLLHRALGIAPTVLEQPEMPVAEGALGPSPVPTARVPTARVPAGAPPGPRAGNTAPVPVRHGPVPVRPRVHRPAPPPLARPARRAAPRYRPVAAGRPPRGRSGWPTWAVLTSVAVLTAALALVTWSVYDRHAYTFQRMHRTMSEALPVPGATVHVPLLVEGRYTYAALPGRSSRLVTYDSNGGGLADTEDLGARKGWASIERYRNGDEDVLQLLGAPDHTHTRRGVLVGDLSAGEGAGSGIWPISLRRPAKLFATSLGVWSFAPRKHVLRRLDPADGTHLVTGGSQRSFDIPAGSRLLQYDRSVSGRNWTVLEASGKVMAYAPGPARTPDVVVPVHSDHAVAVVRDDPTLSQVTDVFVADPTSATDYAVREVTVDHGQVRTAWTATVVKDRTPGWIGLCGGHLCVIDSAHGGGSMRITSYDTGGGMVGRHDVAGLDLSGYWGDASTDDVVLVHGRGRQARTEVFDAGKGTVVRRHPGVGYLVDDRAVLVFQPEQGGQRLTGLDLVGGRHTDVGTVPAGIGDCAWDAHRISCVSGGVLRSWLYRKGGR